MKMSIFKLSKQVGRIVVRVMSNLLPGCLPVLWRGTISETIAENNYSLQIQVDP